MILGLITMMNQEDFIGPVNLGNPTEFSILSLAENVLKLTKSKSRIKFKSLPSDDPYRRQPDITLAKSKLAWAPKIEIDEGLEKTIEYFKGTL